MLPFVDPDSELNLNLGITLIIICILSKTPKGILKINNERLRIYLYLIKNPTSLNRTLRFLGKPVVKLNELETYSVSSISPNIDPLFDREELHSILRILTSKVLIQAEYKEKNGFFLTPTDAGIGISDKLEGQYFLNIKSRCETLKKTLSISETQLSQALNTTIRMESI